MKENLEYIFFSYLKKHFSGLDSLKVQSATDLSEWCQI